MVLTAITKFLEDDCSPEAWVWLHPRAAEMGLRTSEVVSTLDARVHMVSDPLATCS